MASEAKVFVRQYEPNEITADVRDEYCRLLRGDFFHNVPGIGYPDAERMAFDNAQNGLDSMKASADNPLFANLLTAHFNKDLSAIAGMRIGVEKYGDRWPNKDEAPRMHYNLARLAHKLSLMDLSTWQVSGYGALPAVSDRTKLAKEVFQKMVFHAIDNRHESLPPPTWLSAFVDEKDEKLAELMKSINPRTLKVGGRAVKIIQGGVPSEYRRHVVKLPQKR